MRTKRNSYTLSDSARVSTEGEWSSPGMFAEKAEAGSSLRRSKAEMVCDLLKEISGGATRPTRIMQRANLTWSALLMYLNALVTNGLVREERHGRNHSYHLTKKGEELLASYDTLKEGLKPLDLDNLNAKTFARALKEAPAADSQETHREQIAAKLGREGYKILSSTTKGRSGVEHEFKVVARDPEGEIHGYVFSSSPDEQLMLRLFVKQLDTGFRVHVVHAGDPSISAVERAREYGIEFMKWQEAAS